jgi:putative signal transducing protein
MNPGQTTDPFVRLVTAKGLTEADTWKAVLEASGIPVYLRHEAMAALIPETAGDLAAVDLWVPRDQAAQAMEILQDERAEPGEEDEPS